MSHNDKNMLLAIEKNLIKQIEYHKRLRQPRILKKLERHLKAIQRAIDSIES